MTLRELLKKAVHVRPPRGFDDTFQQNGIVSFYSGQGQILTTIIDQRRTPSSGPKEVVGGKNRPSRSYSYCIAIYLNDPSPNAGNASSDTAASSDSNES